MSVGFEKSDFALASDKHDATRHLSRGQGVTYRIVDLCQRP
jgi:hypothetical protein